MLNPQDLPISHGTYALHLYVSHAQPIKIGRLGQHHLPMGDYFYLGSACGAGGLQARVGRHLRGDGARHWHIDYLRAVAEVREVFYTIADDPLECVWSHALAQLSDAFIAIPHFGSSDCRSGCTAHLIAFPRRFQLASAQAVLSASIAFPVVQLRCA